MRLNQNVLTGALLVSCVFAPVWAGNTILASQINNNGMAGNGGIVADADYASGGSSKVEDMSGKCLGPCSGGSVWTVGSAIQNNVLQSRLRVTNWVTSSASGWGWASAGWWILPNLDTSSVKIPTFGTASPIGLQSAAVLTLSMSYTAGQKLTVQLKGQDINENDINQAPPRYVYTGKGTIETVAIPLSMIKRASWSNPKTYDPAKVTAVGLLRIVGAGSQGAAFPATEPATTDFQLASFNWSNGDVAPYWSVKAPDQSLIVGFSPFDLSSLWSAGGTNLSYFVEAKTGVVSVSGTTISPVGQKIGRDTLIITAFNNIGSVMDTILVDVKTDDVVRIKSIPDYLVYDQKSVELNQYMRSLGGTPVSYSVQKLGTSPAATTFSISNKILGIYLNQANATDTLEVTASNSFGSLKDTFVVNTLADQLTQIKKLGTLQLNKQQIVSIPLQDYFTGTALTYVAFPLQSGIVSATVRNDSLVITGLADGQAKVRLSVSKAGQTSILDTLQTNVSGITGVQNTAFAELKIEGRNLIWTQSQTGFYKIVNAQGLVFASGVASQGPQTLPLAAGAYQILWTDVFGGNFQKQAFVIQ